MGFMTCTQALVDLEERHDLLLLPQVGGRRLPADLAVHRVLEQDRAEDAVAAEARARDDARAHLVHEVEHLLLARPSLLVEPVELEGLGRASAALVEGRDESVLGLDLLELFGAHGAAIVGKGGWRRTILSIAPPDTSGERGAGC
jgi:hypothetical protein